MRWSTVYVVWALALASVATAWFWSDPGDAQRGPVRGTAMAELTVSTGPDVAVLDDVTLVAGVSFEAFSTPQPRPTPSFAKHQMRL